MNVKLTATQTTVIKTAATRPDGNIEPLPSNLRGGAKTAVIDGLLSRALIAKFQHPDHVESKGVNSTPTLAEVQTANPANLGLHPDGSATPRCRLPHWNIARKDPFRLGIYPSATITIRVIVTTITTITDAMLM